MLPAPIAERIMGRWALGPVDNNLVFCHAVLNRNPNSAEYRPVTIAEPFIFWCPQPPYNMENPAPMYRGLLGCRS